MRFFFFIIICLLLSVGCRNSSQKSPFRVKGISLITGDKVTTIDGTTKLDTSGIFIFFYDKYVIYKTPKILYRNSKTYTKGDSINVQFMNPDTTFRYFVTEKNNHYGIEYDNDINTGKSFNIDSLLKNKGIHRSMLGAYNLKLGEPINVGRQDASISVEGFLNKKQVEDDPDSIYRYFDKKLTGIDFSFAPQLDKEKNSKLFKTSFINLYSKNNNSGILRAEFYSQFKEISVTDPIFLINLTKKYEHDKKIRGLSKM